MRARILRGWARMLAGLLVLAASCALTACAPPANEAAADELPADGVAADELPEDGAPADEAAISTVRAFLTGYSYFDNTPPGSGRISHPVLHETAGGRGTYEDPVTVAVGHRRDGDRDVLDWPAGTRFYVPNLRRYLIVEDTCGDGDQPQDGPCHTGYPAQASTWLDVWIGGAGGNEQDSRNCMGTFTGVWLVVVDPAPDFVVDPGEIYAPADPSRIDGCTQHYGDGLVRAG